MSDEPTNCKVCIFREFSPDLLCRTITDFYSAWVSSQASNAANEQERAEKLYVFLTILRHFESVP